MDYFDMHHHVPMRDASLWDRIRNSYYAFRFRLTPDTMRILDQIAEIQKQAQDQESAFEARVEASLNKLDGYDKAMVESIAAETENWHSFFDSVLVTIEQNLTVADQLNVVRFMFRSNRNIVRQQSFRTWVSRHADALLDNLPE